jgi:hypothetical protein
MDLSRAVAARLDGSLVSDVHEYLLSYTIFLITLDGRITPASYDKVGSIKRDFVFMNLCLHLINYPARREPTLYPPHVVHLPPFA